MSRRTWAAVVAVILVLAVVMIGVQVSRQPSTGGDAPVAAPIARGQAFRSDKFGFTLAVPADGAVERYNDCSMRIRNFGGDVEIARLAAG